MSDPVQQFHNSNTLSWIWLGVICSNKWTAIS